MASADRVLCLVTRDGLFPAEQRGGEREATLPQVSGTTVTHRGVAR